MAISFEAAGPGHASTATATWAHTTLGGFLLVVAKATRAGGKITEISATCAGNPLARIRWSGASIIDNAPSWALFGDVVPPGTHTLTVSSSHTGGFSSINLGNSATWGEATNFEDPTYQSGGSVSVDTNKPLIAHCVSTTEEVTAYNQSFRSQVNLTQNEYILFGDAPGGSRTFTITPGPGAARHWGVPLYFPTGLPAKQYIGGNWQQIGVLKAHNGTEWVKPKYWNGTEWV